MFQSCNGAKSENETETQTSQVFVNEPEGVHVYYFHATRRCATCQAVENVTKDAINEFFGGDIPFESINREEDKENPLLEKYEITGQTLLVINGDEVTDLTNDAFLSARLKPEDFKSIVKSTIESMK